ncbi:beta-L-arabinofuranosidase domain-containing protein [Micromonospora sp. WMMD1082]|uniref:beta-L-arabinofuranosidase domain-containing protein n=1 Tax=Micromonospora sp. WMMD1082 TaxID=3016104 RepID=UPI0024163C9C|nr:beta-L-arabinofuranosidase domain-containing protein [Micromonospora sp. WMMD1082]MDG4798030.1 glycoside hydrolase family 127 protein [Micromonospora sp. WMMD1082]
MAESDKLSVSRRHVLRASAIGAAAVTAVGALPAATAHAAAPTGITPGPAWPAAIPNDPGPGGTAPVRPFPLRDVTLGDGLLQEKRDRMKHYLRQFDERRFLVLFNEQAGRPNPPGVPVPGGWEDGGLLSGHWAGHFMTALAQGYADHGEPIFKSKLDWMVDELAACQAAITARMGDGGPGGEDPQEPPIGRVPARFGSGLRLNGASRAQYVTLPQEAISQLTDFTIATWVNLAAAQSWSRLFDFGQNTTINMFLTARAGVTGNVPRFAITVGGSGAEQRIDGASALPTNQWVHLAVTLAQNTGTLYVNGQQVGRNPNMTLSPADLGNPGNRWIGRSQYGDPYLDATVDEFHIFDRALGEPEVRSLLDSPAGSTGGGSIAWYRFEEQDGSTIRDSSPHGRDGGIVASQGGGTALWTPTHPGYLGAIPEDAVLRLGPPRWAVYGGNTATNTWAPWYTQHKIMRGLLDAYYHTDNQRALDVVVTMADWAHLALTVGDKNHPAYPGPITRDNLNYMWDLYIAGETGGANEVFPEIYALTGDAKHLDTARLFDNRESLFDACVDNRDILVTTPQTNPGRRRPDRLHANSHVPQFVGYLRVYEHSGDRDYLQAARNFFGMVVPHRMYANGGTSGNYPGSNNNTELFQNRGNIANSIAQGGAETCTTYNLIKLARNLFLHEQDPAYLDYYERGLLNQIAGSRADTTNVSNPQVTYFQPLTPGTVRSYGNTGTCCGGTGIENHTKYQETIYFKSADGGTLWVNLYASSTLTWAERGFTVTQETSYPRDDRTTLTVNGSGPLDIKLRVPGWVRNGFLVTINGEPQQVDPRPGSYLTVRRSWQPGDTIDIRMPFSIRIERAPDRPDTQSIFWGPVLMQILGNPGGGNYRELSLYRHLKRDGDYARSAITHASTTAAGDRLFATQGFSLRPYYIGDTQAASSYFRRIEPTVVFGSIDTGVPNRKRDDGLPHYDVPVAGVESPGSDGPTFLDLVWDEAPFAGHGEFVSTVTRIADEFVAAAVFTPAERESVVSHAGRADRELDPAPAWNVEVQVRAQVTGTNAYVSVSAHNADEVPLTIELITAYGSRTVTGVAPGRAAYQAFNTRAGSVPAGAATVRITGSVDGEPVTAQIEAQYDAISVG